MQKYIYENAGDTRQLAAQLYKSTAIFESKDKSSKKSKGTYGYSEVIHYQNYAVDIYKNDGTYGIIESYPFLEKPIAIYKNNNGRVGEKILNINNYSLTEGTTNGVRNRFYIIGKSAYNGNFIKRLVTIEDIFDKPKEITVYSKIQLY